MNFRGILAEGEGHRPIAAAPDYFVDLNLDQIVAAITSGVGEYDLKPFFNAPLRSPEAIKYRHEVMKDVEKGTVLQFLKAFAVKMRSMREHLTQSSKMHYRYQKESLFLDAVEIYCLAVRTLLDDLRSAPLTSRGLLGFLDYLEQDYVKADRFAVLYATTVKLKEDLKSIRYALLIRTGMLTVTKYDSEQDYGAVIQGVFEKFKQGEASRHAFKILDSQQMNHIEAGVLDRVARLFPDPFSRLDKFFAENSNFTDETIGAFDREIHFYVSYVDYIAPLKEAGLQFCYPDIATADKSISADDTFDLALTRKLLTQSAPIVRNSFFLTGKERIFIVSGPNQGGKTTFARTFGQLHHLAAIGCPVPGAKARLFLFDQLLTHFEREEDIHNLRGKLQDDLVRIHDILRRATSDSIVIMNEIFNSTTFRDALFLSKKVINTLIKLDAICVCVTFIDELTQLSDTAVSMVSNVVPENPAERTYKIVRRPADGLAYALSIAEKYGLTYHQLRERLAP